MAQKKKNQQQVITVYIAQTKNYVKGMDVMIKKTKELISVEKEYQELLKKRK